MSKAELEQEEDGLYDSDIDSELRVLNLSGSANPRGPRGQKNESTLTPWTSLPGFFDRVSPNQISVPQTAMLPAVLLPWPFQLECYFPSARASITFLSEKTASRITLGHRSWSQEIRRRWWLVPIGLRCSFHMVHHLINKRRSNMASGRNTRLGQFLDFSVPWNSSLSAHLPHL